MILQNLSQKTKRLSARALEAKTRVTRSSPSEQPPEFTPSLGSIITSGPVLAVLCVTLLGLAFESNDRLRPFRFLSSPEIEGETEEAITPVVEPVVIGETELGESQNTARNSAGQAQHRGPLAAAPGFSPPELPAIEAEESPVEIVLPNQNSLAGFFSALSRTQAKKERAITRIAHFGDSIVVSDYISGTLRRKFQSSFGDAGHGYLLLASAWPAYRHDDVFRFATKGFRASRIVGPLTKDGLYGLGGVTFRAHSGVIARFGTIDEGKWGRKVSRFEVSYLARPGGGTFELSVDGEHRRDVDTNANQTEVRREEVRVPDGPHLLEMRTKKGETRGFGVVLEREGPGVVLDALGIQGARIRFLDEQSDDHFKSELKWRRPDLIVYQFGANESADGYAYSMEDYLQTMKAVISQGKNALPGSSCLIIAAMDRARLQSGVMSSMKIIPLIVEQQEIAARDLDCAFFNTYEAMGGWGSMPKWVRRGLGQADMTHPSGVGAIRIGTWIYGALMKEYDRFLRPPAPD